MAKTKKTRRSRFEGINLDTLNQEAAKITNQKLETSKTPKAMDSTKENAVSEDKNIIKKQASQNTIDRTKKVSSKKKKGRPKSSKRRPLNTAIEPKNRQRLEFLAMLNGGSVADQLNNILERYFTEIEKVDELIELFEERKKVDS